MQKPEGNADIRILPAAEMGDRAIRQMAEIYSRIWQKVYFSQYGIQKPSCVFEAFCERDSLELQYWLAREFPETQLVAYHEESGLVAGKINTIPKDAHYMELPENWEEMLQFRNSPKGSLLVPMSIGVRDEFRRYGIAKRLIAETKEKALSLGYKSLATYSTITGCPNDMTLKEYFERSMVNGRSTDSARGLHEDCKARLVRIMEGIGEMRVRYGFRAASFLYFELI